MKKMKIIYSLFIIILLTTFNVNAERVIVKVKNVFTTCQDIKDNGFSTGNGDYDINFYGELKTVYIR